MKYTKKIVLAALFVALDIIFTRFLSVYMPPGTYLVRIGPQFLANALAGWVLGPLYAVLTCVAGDLIGILLFPGGTSFLVGYTVSAALSGLIYALMLYKRGIKLWRCYLAVVCVTLLISMALGSLWYVLYRSDVKTLAVWSTHLLSTAPWRLAAMAAYPPVLYLVQKGLVRARVLDKEFI